MMVEGGRAGERARERERAEMRSFAYKLPFIRIRIRDANDAQVGIVVEVGGMIWCLVFGTCNFLCMEKLEINVFCSI